MMHRVESDEQERSKELLVSLNRHTATRNNLHLAQQPLHVFQTNGLLGSAVELIDAYAGPAILA